MALWQYILAAFVEVQTEIQTLGLMEKKWKLETWW
jgi:hypothetical protein